jgi:hypothetical protein
MGDSQGSPVKIPALHIHALSKALIALVTNQPVADQTALSIDQTDNSRPAAMPPH